MSNKRKLCSGRRRSEAQIAVAVTMLSAICALSLMQYSLLAVTET